MKCLPSLVDDMGQLIADRICLTDTTETDLRELPPNSCGTRWSQVVEVFARKYSHEVDVAEQILTEKYGNIEIINDEMAEKLITNQYI